MSISAFLSFALGLLGPLALAAACIFELLARRTAGKKSADSEKLERIQTAADIGLVAAWLFLAAAYVVFSKLTADAAIWETAFQTWMTAVLWILCALDILYLYLRRSGPRGKKSGRSGRTGRFF